MVGYVNNPPDAAALMTSARSFGNYDLAGAIADLIDNSIKAGAKRIDIDCEYNEADPIVRVRDDGHGMSWEELISAMRPASRNPLEERSPDDLGRFGWGMKSASFSQCRLLTVVSSRDGLMSSAAWDLDDLDDWKMAVLYDSDCHKVCSEALLKMNSGTEVIWSKCDRLSEEGTLRPAEFNELVAHTRGKLALIFHRYIGGTSNGRKLVVAINGTPIPRFDPFHRKHAATQPLEEESLALGGAGHILVKPYILPHYSKLRADEFESLSGEEGIVKNQGFYIYRNDRLILYGTWFRLLRHGELSQLVRVSVDIPNSLDSIWKITVDKSDAQLPGVLRNRLKQIVEGLRKRSARVHRSKGGRIDPDGRVQSVWRRYLRRGEIRYEINREHPLIRAAAVEGGSDRAFRAALSVIEREFPVALFTEDSSRNIDSIHQSEASPDAFKRFLEDSLPVLLAQERGDMQALLNRLRATEPYRSNWALVDRYLAEEEWVDGQA